MESDLVSMAQSFTGLPMDALIGGPLNAAATANAAMALTQTKFMLDTCFTKVPGNPAASPPTADNYQPIMIVMSITRGVLTPDTTSSPPTTTIQSVTTSFNLPLLTIIPLNSLAVQTVDVTFEMEVSSSYQENQTDTTSKEIQAAASFDAKFSAGPFSVEVKGSASYDQKDSSTHDTHYQKSNSAKYTVNVHAGQLPLPNGVNVIIQAFTNAIQPIQMPAPSH